MTQLAVTNCVQADAGQLVRQGLLGFAGLGGIISGQLRAICCLGRRVSLLARRARRVDPASHSRSLGTRVLAPAAQIWRPTAVRTFFENQGE